VHRVLHLKVLPTRQRVVSSIIEVQKDYDEGVRYNELFAPRLDRTAMPATPPSQQLYERLQSGGLERNLW
jgi:hypothetical protein